MHVCLPYARAHFTLAVTVVQHLQTGVLGREVEQYRAPGIRNGNTDPGWGFII